MLIQTDKIWKKGAEVFLKFTKIAIHFNPLHIRVTSLFSCGFLGFFCSFEPLYDHLISAEIA